MHLYNMYVTEAESVKAVDRVIIFASLPTRKVRTIHHGKVLAQFKYIYLSST